VSFHRWGLGFKQCSFRLIARALRDKTLSVFEPFPLLRHALFPSGFRPQVNRMAQRYPSEPLLTVSRIQYRVPRRTVSAHPALIVQPPPDAASASVQRAQGRGGQSAESSAPSAGDAASDVGISPSPSALSADLDSVTPGKAPTCSSDHSS
jgi:hypothetical protein